MSKAERILLIIVGALFLIFAGGCAIWLLPFIGLGFSRSGNGLAQGLSLFFAVPGLLIVAASLVVGWRLLKAAGHDLRLLVGLAGMLLLFDGFLAFLIIASAASSFWHFLLAPLAAMIFVIPGTWLLRLERKG